MCVSAMSTRFGSGVGKPRVNRCMIQLLIGCSAVLSGPAFGQSIDNTVQAQRKPLAKDDKVSEIVITAQRRDENVQNVPIDVVAFGATNLAHAGVASTRDLQVLAPTFDYGDSSGWSYNTLRGVGSPAIGPGIESPVAMYIDGVYQAALVSSPPSFADVKSVEVIAGPQGTLFGRNATAGVIQIITKDPSLHPEGSISAGYANYNTATGSLYLTGPVTQNVATSLAIDGQHQGRGYGEDLRTGQRIGFNRYFSVRNKWLLKPTSNLTVRLNADYLKSTSSSSVVPVPGAVFIGSTTPFDLPPRTSLADNRPLNRLSQGGVSATIAYDLPGVRLTSISAYRQIHLKADIGTSSTGPDYAGLIFTDESHKQYSEELQLSSLPGASLTWTAGVFLFGENSNWNPATLTGNLYLTAVPQLTGGDPLTKEEFFLFNKTRSAAIYAQATKQIFDATNLTLGFRYTVERRRFTQGVSIVDALFGPFDSVQSASKTFRAPTWRIALDHHFSPNLLGYLSYNRGFKSGVFDPTSSPLHAVDPEKLDAFEAGLKSELLDRHVRLNAGAFYYKYKNMQVISFVNTIPALSNGADAELYGIDVSGEAHVTSNLTLNGGFSLMHAKFTKFPAGVLTLPNPNTDPALPPGGYIQTTADLSGNHIPHAPKAVVDLSATYSVPLRSGVVDATVAFSHNSGWYAEADNRLRQRPYDLLNASIGWTSGSGFNVKLWARNILNTYYFASMTTETQGEEAQFGDPRTYGVTVAQKF